MCNNVRCTNTTRHIIFILSIVSILLLIGTPNLNFWLPGANPEPPPPQAGRARGGGNSGGGSRSNKGSLCPLSCAATAACPNRVNAIRFFLYGVLFTSVVITLAISKNHVTDNNNLDDDVDYVPRVFVGSIGGPPPGDGGGGGRRQIGGIGDALLRTFPTFAYSARRRPGRMGKGVGVCVICQSKLKDDQMVRWLPDCDHIFHLACIDEWLASHKTCPCCRVDLELVTGECCEHVYQFQF